jgi:hypothetical protein
VVVATTTIPRRPRTGREEDEAVETVTLVTPVARMAPAEARRDVKVAATSVKFMAIGPESARTRRRGRQRQHIMPMSTMKFSQLSLWHRCAIWCESQMLQLREFI